MTSIRKLQKLCQRFERNLQAYKQGRYKETQLRREFIDPLFKLMGWDMYNEKGYAEAYKEVIHEDAIKVGGLTKAPDYCFRVGGVRKFFMETKKPSIDIKGDVHPAYQLRRYAWSAKLPLSILTDFEELAVYDCRIKPVKTDKAATARILYLTHKDYPTQWDEIIGIFSPEAIRKGSFDKYVEEKKKKRGTAEVDAAFLQEIERWRDMLARNVALRNPRLSQRELNFATQRTIDRIIFLRICEDRGIEPYGQLMALQNGENIYKRLMELFDRADDRYNSGLFHFDHEAGRPDESIDNVTLDLTIDDKILKDVFKNLYYPDSPYEFSVLPADILGQVYEQFLGKVIRLTPGHRAVVEDKPEVRKAGGVYYTPTYIVDYIVKQTVGKLLEGKKPGPRSPVNKLRILDPACGSGSFLLGAYQYLLDWHRDQYIEDDPKKWSRGRSPRLFKTDSGEWKLTIEERKRILMSNIYGVDIDRQAVEVTKLSLLLKVMEDEQSVVRQLSFFRERVLPDLGNNIKCGNSLIGPDFWEGKQMALLDNEEMLRINAFDWEAEFPEIMRKGGFDVVIGNPPWGASFTLEEKDYMMAKFSNVHMRTPDSFNYFLANSYMIASMGGTIGMIIPNNFLFQHEYAKARHFYIKNAQIQRAINLGDGVFKATAPSCVAVINRETRRLKKGSIGVADLRKLDRELLASSIDTYPLSHIEPKDILAAPDSVILMDKAAIQLIARILKHIPTKLGNLCDQVASGIGTGGDKVFRIDNKTASESSLELDILFPILIGREMNSYYVPEKTGHLIIYSTKAISKKTHPNVLAYLQPFQEKLSKKRETRKGLIPWWSLHWPRNPKLFDAPKIVLRQTASSLYAAIDTAGYYCLDSIIIIRPKNPALRKYYVGLLNSQLLRWIYSNLIQEQSRVFAQVKPINLRKLPIRTIDFAHPVEKKQHDRMVKLVDRITDLHKQLSQVKPPQVKTTLKRQIEAIDRQIDQLVYELYSLTEKEIKIVEESLG